VIAKVRANRINPSALAIRFHLERARLLERIPGGACGRGGWRSRQRVAQKIERDAPVRHRAVGILLQHALKSLAGVVEPVGVQHGDAGLELGLHPGIARRREGHLSELVVLRSGTADKQEDDKKAEKGFAHSDDDWSAAQACQDCPFPHYLSHDVTESWSDGTKVGAEP
jgi:hypothetical protein